MDNFTGEVTGLAFGGEGIIRQDRLVVFVPFTAPGDVVSYRITKKKKNFASGALLNIATPSPLRIAPRCPYFGTCGGCQLQHLDYKAQLDYKQQCVADSVQRIGHLSPETVAPAVAAKQQWAYRRHVTFQLIASVDSFKMGYIAADNTSLLEVSSCPIFVEPGNPIVEDMRSLISQLKGTDGNNGRVTVLKLDNEGYAFHFQFERLPEGCEPLFEQALKRYPTWQGIVVTTPKKTLVFGTVAPTLAIDNLIFTFSPRAFIQNHPEQSLNIYRSIRDIAMAAGARKVVDLYCGIGISSLLLAKQGMEVVGVEYNKEAIALANGNAIKNGIGTATFVQADVKRVIRDLLKKNRPDLIVVNPPRTGMDPAVVQALADSGAREIIYISCMPSTLARDLAVLCKEKYRLASCQPYDMFPQTAHVETVVRLTAL